MSREIRAQALLLESVLNNRPLPGMTNALTVPNNVVSGNDGQIILVDDRSPSELSFPSQVKIITRDDMESLASDNQLHVFEFLPPEHFPGKISVRLRLSVMWPGRRLLPAVEIVATFNDQDPLTAVEPTHVVAF